MLPDINRSTGCLSIEDGNLRLGFDCVKGLSDELIRSILLEREGRSFDSFCDFLARVKNVHRSGEGLVNLIRGGTFDSFGLSRSRLLGWHGDADAMKTFDKLDEYWNQSLQSTLHFDDIEPPDEQSRYSIFSSILKRISSTSSHDSAQMLSEMESASLFCTPAQLQIYPYRDILSSMRSVFPDRAAYMRVGRISHINETIEFDEKARRRLSVVFAWFEGTSESYRIQLTTTKKDFSSLGIREGSLVQIKRQSFDWSGGAVEVSDMRLLPSIREMARRIIIKLDPRELTREKVRKLKITLESYRGINPVCIHVKDGDRKLSIELPLMIDLTDQILLSYLRGIFDHVEVVSVYDENIW